MIDSDKNRFLRSEQMIFLLGFFAVLTLRNILFARQFNIDPSISMFLFYCAVFLIAFCILRGDTKYIIINPTDNLYGQTRFIWRWHRAIILLLVIPAFWAIPLGYGYVSSVLALRETSTEILLQAILVQFFLVACAEELFFREAGIKAFRHDLVQIYLFTGGAFFIMHLNQGLGPALIALGVGTVYMTIRIAGVNIILVAVLHGITNVIFSKLVSIGLGSDSILFYGLFFFIVTSALSLLVFIFFIHERRPANA